jgi:8-oxo-dGTP diphosphatase
MNAESDPQHIRFAVLAADVAVFTMREGKLLVRMMKVERPPYFPNHRGLPGGLIHPKEIAEDTARRIIEDRARIAPKKVHLEQLYTFSEIDRDPRGRVVAVAYIGLVAWDQLSAEEQKDSPSTWWAPVKGTSRLAYDHDEILKVALNRLRSRIEYTTVISKLVRKEFTLTELEEAYECILGKSLDKRNFRKKILKLDILKEVSGKRTIGKFRPAQLYRFTSNSVQEIEIV